MFVFTRSEQTESGFGARERFTARAKQAVQAVQHMLKDPGHQLFLCGPWIKLSGCRENSGIKIESDPLNKNHCQLQEVKGGKNKLKGSEKPTEQLIQLLVIIK